MAKIDARRVRMVFGVGMPLAHVIEGLVGLPPPPQSHLLVVCPVPKKAEASPDVLCRWNGGLHHMQMGPATVAHQDPTGFGGRFGQLSERREPLKQLGLNEQQAVVEINCL